MQTPTTNSGLRDSHARRMVADILRAKMQNGSRLSVASAYFTICDCDSLADRPAGTGHLDFVF